MIITQNVPEYTPITVTLSTEQEAETLYKLLDLSLYDLTEEEIEVRSNLLEGLRSCLT